MHTEDLKDRKKSVSNHINCMKIHHTQKLLRHKLVFYYLTFPSIMAERDR